MPASPAPVTKGTAGLAQVQIGRCFRSGRVLALAGLGLALLVAVVLATAVGSVGLRPAEVAAALVAPLVQRLGLAAAPGVSDMTLAVVWQVRLPRVLMAVVVGAGLAGTGAAYQGLLGNPLADPYLLGVSGGASMGAAVALALAATGTLGYATVPVFAFVGALLASLVVYGLARGKSGVSPMGLVLAGVAISAFTGAVISYLLTTGPDWLRTAILSWLSGGLDMASWDRIGLVAPYIAGGLVVLQVFARDLNVMLLGDDAARQSGVAVGTSRGWILATASLVTAATVSVTGLIGFVGLVVPHMVRLVFGADHRTLLPAAALGGALFLLAADTAGRTLWAPAQVRVSIISGLAGAPYFLFLLRRYLGRNR